jgi:glycosyltransferase involved in cell wall biosynthesis
MPQVSVLVAAFNGSTLIGRAIASAGAQSFRDLEIVVVDDGSTDDTAAVALAAGATRVIRQANRGIGATRRRLLEEARGEWVAFLDHDDWWSPDKLMRQMHQVDERVGLVHTESEYFTESGRTWIRGWTPPPGADAFDHLIPDCKVVTSSTLIRREALLEAGSFPEDLSQAEDWLAWMRLASRWRFGYVSEPLTHYFLREGSASTPGEKMYRAERTVVQERVLPEFDRLFARCMEPDRRRFRRLLERKLGVIASLQAELRDREGDRGGARALHLEAVRRAPGVKGAWFRLGRHLLRLG